MKGLPFVLLFTAMTFVSWGAYGPVLHHGAEALEHDSMRAFVGVGLAYFLIAVIFPVLILRAGGETGNWTVLGVVYSLLAGAVGAVGALGIILALGYGGQTLYVMPLVFGFAPVVNTLVTALLSRTFNQISPIFIFGIVTAALGAGGVLYFKPSPQSVAKGSPASEASAAEAAANTDEEGEIRESSSEGGVSQPMPKSDASGADEAQQGESRASSEGTHSPSPEAGTPAGEVEDAEKAEGEGADPGASDAEAKADVEESQPDVGSSRLPVGESYVVKKPAVDGPAEGSTAKPTRKLNVFLVAVSIIIAALCWGSYGPMLHIGQGKMNGSRLRPFTCVGLAYFFIAVAAPIFVIYSRAADTGAWTAGGMTWSFLAGVAGAVGALGVILAFNSGGKPYYVMPLIFGFAPVINTFISLSEAGTWGQASPLFWISLALVITGAVTVLTNAPKPKPKPKLAT